MEKGDRVFAAGKLILKAKDAMSTVEFGVACANVAQFRAKFEDEAAFLAECANIESTNPLNAARRLIWNAYEKLFYSACIIGKAWGLEIDAVALVEGLFDVGCIEVFLRTAWLMTKHKKNGVPANIDEVRDFCTAVLAAHSE